MKTIASLVNNIQARDLVLGELANEAVQSAEARRFMAALSCLFVFMEQSIKLASNEVDGNLNDQIISLGQNGLISPSEVTDLQRLRQIRNKLFHENNYMWAFEDENGDAFLLSEAESREKIWNSVAERVFFVCLRLLTSS